MTGLYEIDYLFLDELDEKGFRTSNVVVYDSSEVGFGETLQYAMDKTNENGDYSGVDKLLGEKYGLSDDDIAFYCDLAYIEERNTSKSTRLVCELQQSHDILIKNIYFIK